MLYKNAKVKNILDYVKSVRFVIFDRVEIETLFFHFELFLV